MVSKIKWKPFWLATQADNTTQMVVDDDVWFDIGSDHNICCFWKVFVALEHYGSGGVGKEKATRRCEKNIWTWKTKGKVTWVAYKKKVEGKILMELFGLDMQSGKDWTAKKRYNVF